MSKKKLTNDDINELICAIELVHEYKEKNSIEECDNESCWYKGMKNKLKRMEMTS